MARGHDPEDRREQADEEQASPDEKTESEEPATRPQPELRWVQLRKPRHAIEIGRNGRILASKYHERWDAWEVLLETYEGELSD